MSAPRAQTNGYAHLNGQIAVLEELVRLFLLHLPMLEPAEYF